MKNSRTTRKLTLNAETIAHLRQLAPIELDRARGGEPPRETFQPGACPKTGASLEC
jgi:hypothetical protein